MVPNKVTHSRVNGKTIITIIKYYLFNYAKLITKILKEKINQINLIN